MLSLGSIFFHNFENEERYMEDGEEIKKIYAEIRVI